MNNSQPSHVQAIERVAALVMRAQANSEQSDITTGPCNDEEVEAIRLTDRKIASLKPKAERYEVWEPGGFGVRVFPSGERSFIYMYRMNGKARRMTLGSYPKVSLARAHVLHAQAREMKVQGIDPGKEKAERLRPVLHAQQIAAKLDRLIENVAKSNELLRLVPTRTPTGASAVVRPVPGGEHRGTLQLIEFTQPANGAVSRNADQTLTYRPKPGFTGKDSFDYTLRDDAGTIFSAMVTVAVTLEAPDDFAHVAKKAGR